MGESSQLGPFTVSRLSMGCATIGQPYGLQSEMVSDSMAKALLRRALDSGINFFDTAAGYRKSQRIVTETLEGEGVISTKVPVEDRRRAISQVRSFLRQSGRQKVDIVYGHNYAYGQFEYMRSMVSALSRFVTMFGVTVYDLEAAEDSLFCDSIQVIQVPYSILDQKVKYRPPHGIHLVARSVLLQGVLTPRIFHHRLDRGVNGQLFQMADKARSDLGLTWAELPIFCIRFALSNYHFSSVLVGIASNEEMDVALEAWRKGPLISNSLYAGETCAVENKLTDPRNWTK